MSQQAEGAPSAWIGQEVKVQYAEGGRSGSLNCTLQAVNQYGVTVTVEENTSFFPWNNVIRVELGHGREPQRQMRVRR